MHVVLVGINPALFAPGYYHMPLGLLSLAATAEERGHDVEIIQLDEVAPELDTEQIFQRWIDIVGERRCDVLGLSTRCDTLPLAIELARRFKLRYRHVPVVLGGPGSSFIDELLLQTFPHVDIIVRGEGDLTFPELVGTLESGEELSKTAGITFRDKAGYVRVNPDRPKVKRLASLPRTPYHLVHTHLADSSYFKTDILFCRGCPIACDFCSTCAFWGRSVRVRPPSQVVSEMKALHEHYGFTVFNLIGDNVWCQKTALVELCHLIRQELPGIQWRVSASLNLFCDDTMKEMADSGCTSIFLGVETGSDRLVSYLPRKHLNAVEVRRRVERIRQHGVSTIQSFILGFPDEDRDDVNTTIRLATQIQAMAPIELGDSIQFHPLGIHPGSLLYRKYVDRMSYQGVFGDFASSYVTRSPSCLALCHQYPQLFTAYACHTDRNEAERIHELCEFYKTVSLVFPKTLTVLFTELGTSPLECLRLFRQFMGNQPSGMPDLVRYGDEQGFVRDIVLKHVPPFVLNIYDGTTASTENISWFLQAEVCAANAVTGAYRLSRPRRIADISTDSRLSQLTPVVPRTTNSIVVHGHPDAAFASFLKSGTIRDLASRDPLEVTCYRPRAWLGNSAVLAFGVQVLDPIERCLIRISRRGHTCREVCQELARRAPLDRRDTAERAAFQRLQRMITRGLLVLQGEVDV